MLIDTLMVELKSVAEIELPGNRSEINIFKQGLQRALNGEEMMFYVGSCPDYSNDGKKYTHESLGDGVPLLTRHHLEVDVEVLEILRKFGIKANLTIMMADVEAMDDVFVGRFAGGDRREFIFKCKSSVGKTAAEASGKGVISSSFFLEFGHERFMEYQSKYEAVLRQKYYSDSSFHHRVNSDIYYRQELYRKMYPFIYESARMTSEDRRDFLAVRTMRTMAQYLTLGRLIGQMDGPVAIINHPTTNVNMFNSRGKFLLPEDDPRYPQPTVPIFTMTRKVY